MCAWIAAAAGPVAAGPVVADDVIASEVRAAMQAAASDEQIDVYLVMSNQLRLEAIEATTRGMTAR
ncbi:MAG: hypothetical protein VCC68_12935, partial [Myxococcota bacterium]